MSYSCSTILGEDRFTNDNFIHMIIIGKGDNLISDPQFRDIKVWLSGLGTFTEAG